MSREQIAQLIEMLREWRHATRRVVDTGEMRIEDLRLMRLAAAGTDGLSKHLAEQIAHVEMYCKGR
jgi:hypothetical protein